MMPSTSTPAPTARALVRWVDRQSCKVRTAMTAGALLGYLALFAPLASVMGPPVGAFYAVVAVTAGWLKGRVGGTIIGILALPVNWFAYTVLADVPKGSLVGGIGAALANLLVGFFVGAWSDSRRREQRQGSLLALTESRLSLVAKATKDIIFDHDVIGGATWVNEEFRRVAGIPPRATVTLQTWLAAVHPEDRARAGAALQDALASGKDHYTNEYRMVLPDGSVRHQLTRAFIFRRQGLALRVIGAVTDVSAIHQAQEMAQARVMMDALAHENERQIERLKEMGEFKTNLLNMAAHELNTPLSAIRLQLHLLRASKAERPPAERKGLELLERNVTRLGDMLRNTLDVARLESGHLSIAPQRTRVDDLVGEVVATLDDLARRGGITIRSEVPADLHVEADPGRLAQVLYNLVGNGIKFTPPGGAVTVRVHEDGMSTRFEVADTGMGLDPAQSHKLFQPFSQVHGAQDAPKAGGTGLGLFICKGIVEGHGGRLWAESPGRGRGARFLFEIPRILAHGSASPRPVEVVA